jgi:hypothetical protein
MSTATGIISSSAAVSYATQLAQTSSLKRSLSNLGHAIQNGELVPASAILTAFFKANPQYTSTSAEDTTSPDLISQDFQTLAVAISNNQVDAAQTAWTQVKSDLANDGVSSVANGTSELLAQTKASLDQQIVSDAFGVSSGSDATIIALLGGNDTSSSQTGLSSSLIESWLTYQQSGTTAPAATGSSAGNLLNKAV